MKNITFSNRSAPSTWNDIALNPGCLIGILDPYNGAHYISPYNWVVFHPLYTAINQGFLVIARIGQSTGGKKNEFSPPIWLLFTYLANGS